MSAAHIFPTTYPLGHAHRMELPTWLAEKLREAWSLSPVPVSHADELEVMLIKARAK